MPDDKRSQDEDAKDSIRSIPIADSDNGTNQEASYQTAQSESPFFVRDLEYSKEEEAKVIRTLDTRLFPWILLTT